MKNTLLKIATVLVLGILIMSCSKDDDNPTPIPVVYGEENFLEAYLSTSGLNQVVQNVSEPSTSVIEYLEFSPTEKGRINAFTFTIPAVSGSNTVSIKLVDAATGDLLQQVGLGDGTFVAGTKKTVYLEQAIDLIKDKRYKLGLLTRSTYERRRTNSADVAYPIQAGNIKIWGFSETVISTMVNTNNPVYYYGDFSFNFQRIE